jgi:hypothetical protein
MIELLIVIWILILPAKPNSLPFLLIWFKKQEDILLLDIYRTIWERLIPSGNRDSTIYERCTVLLSGRGVSIGEKPVTWTTIFEKFGHVQ